MIKSVQYFHSADERTTAMVLEAHQTYIYLCGRLQMTSPRDAFVTSLCKACLPPKFAVSLITQRGPTKTRAATSTTGSTSSPRSSKRNEVSCFVLYYILQVLVYFIHTSPFSQ